jgi:hypothetical protein
VNGLNKRQKTEFGIFLVEQIKNAKMSQEEFYNAVGIKKPYFYNLLTSSPPPIDLQNRMLKVFDDKTGVNEERRRKLYDLAAAGRNEIPADIAGLISGHPRDLDKIRMTLTTLLMAQDKTAIN